MTQRRTAAAPPATSSATSRSKSRARPGPRSGPRYEDQSWYGVLAPYPDPRIVTFVTMEEGGFGAEAAAPAARRILEAIFAKELSEGSEPEGGEEG